jgi:hypothetical protein
MLEFFVNRGRDARSSLQILPRVLESRAQSTVPFFFSMDLPAHSGPRPHVQFRNPFLQAIGLLGRVISQSQGRYLHTGQHKHRINAYTYQHPCPEWDSNPRSQSPRERKQFMP